MPSGWLKLNGERFDLSAERVLVGRGKHCDLVVASNRIAREHFVILRRLSDFYIDHSLLTSSGLFIKSGDGTLAKCDRWVQLIDGQTIIAGAVPMAFHMKTDDAESRHFAAMCDAPDDESVFQAFNAWAAQQCDARAARITKGSTELFVGPACSTNVALTWSSGWVRQAEIRELHADGDELFSTLEALVLAPEAELMKQLSLEVRASPARSIDGSLAQRQIHSIAELLATCRLPVLQRVKLVGLSLAAMPGAPHAVIDRG